MNEGSASSFARRASPRRQEEFLNIHIIFGLVTLVPLDEEAILDSVKKTGRLVVVDEDYRFCGFSAEVAALVAEKALSCLEAPVARVATPNMPLPYNPSLEKHLLPSKEKIVGAVRRAMG